MEFLHFFDARDYDPVADYLSTLQKKEISKLDQYIGLVS